jgi:hypothetical protein
MHDIKLLPCEGEVAPSAGTEGLLRLFESNGGNAAYIWPETLPSATSADTFPSQGRSYFTANFTTLRLMYKDMHPRGGAPVCGVGGVFADI